jgi:hypothetical protein
VGDVENARSDLEGLKAFDTNGDGKLGAGDARFGEFRLWRDRNGDGVAEPSEITTLAGSNVASIDLAGTPTNLTVRAGDAVAINTGQFTKLDGGRGMFSDAAFTYFSGAGVAARPPSIAVARQGFAKKSDRYLIAAINGELFVTPRKAGAALDPAAGRIAPASLLTFKNKSVGMLAPVVLDLDGDGLELVSRSAAKARFDMNGDGVRDDTGWIGSGDGFLVIDRDGDGLITNATELSFLSEKPVPAATGRALIARLERGPQDRRDGSALRRTPGLDRRKSERHHGRRRA